MKSFIKQIDPPDWSSPGWSSRFSASGTEQRTRPHTLKLELQRQLFAWLSLLFIASAAAQDLT